MKYAIITGASRGLGASIASQLIRKGIHIISVSRNENDELSQFADSLGKHYSHYPCDLASPDMVERIFRQILSQINRDAELIYLINNAGMVEPIHPTGKLDSSQLIHNLHVNLTATMLSTNLFLQNKGAKTIVANVTSGAAERPIKGWSIYCSTKAAVNMFTKTTAMELDDSNCLHKIIAFNPGIMDTKMQETIRSSSKEAFSDIETFKQYKEDGSLRNPEVVAAAFINLLESDTLENGRIYKVSELL